VLFKNCHYPENETDVVYQKSTLENGIRVVTLSMPSVRSISMSVLIDTGIMDEPEEKNGLAHMIEHMMFRGTRNRDSLQIARFMDEAGGQMGGFVSRDYTCFTATVLDDYRTFALDLLGDISLNSLFLSDDIEREKATILREIEYVTDIPDQRVDGLLKSHIWKGHYLGKTINGNKEEVEKLTREDVLKFVNANYCPDRTIIAAAGNVRHQDFISQVQDAFWRMEGVSVPRQRFQPKFHNGIVIETMPVSQVYFSIGLRAYPYTHPLRYNLHIANKILGGGISSRLFRRIREEYGLVYDISSEYQAYREDGLLVVEGSTSPAYFTQVLQLTLDEIHRTVSGINPIGEEELWKAKMQIRGQHLIAAECSNTQMSRLSTQELYFGEHINSGRILKAIDTVEYESLKTVTTDLLLSTMMYSTLVVIGPLAPEYYNSSIIEDIWHKYDSIN
jgi:predicted Zn-dependent peptidase